MADDFKELRNKGYDLGKLLENGDANQAKAGYDALILRIHDENRDKPAVEAARVEQVQMGMAQANPADVKSPGNGMDHGYYIYWNTENTVTEALRRVDDYCKTHGNCQGIGWRESSLPNTSGAQDPDAVANLSPKGQKELADMLQQTNDWLYKSLPDGLEHYVFKEDFNRRRHQFGIQSDIDEYLSVIIHEKKQ